MSTGKIFAKISRKVRKICARKHINEERDWIYCSSTSSNDWGNKKSLFHVSGEFISHVWVGICQNLSGLIRNAWNWYCLFILWVQKPNRQEQKTQETIFLYFLFSLSHNPDPKPEVPEKEHVTSTMGGGGDRGEPSAPVLYPCLPVPKPYACPPLRNPPPPPGRSSSPSPFPPSLTIPSLSTRHCRRCCTALACDNAPFPSMSRDSSHWWDCFTRWLRRWNSYINVGSFLTDRQLSVPRHSE